MYNMGVSDDDFVIILLLSDLFQSREKCELIYKVCDVDSGCSAPGTLPEKESSKDRLQSTWPQRPILRLFIHVTQILVA